MSLFEGISQRLTAVKGMHDLVPPHTQKYAAAEFLCREVFNAFGYEEIRTPVVEYTDLFARSVGETTDIVHKEMFTFPDRKGRLLTLRPENTAGVARAVVERRLASDHLPLRLWYCGPQFRYEQPQKGRYREFRQIGAELFGAPGPAGDAEILAMLFRYLERLEFKDLAVRLNAIGSGEARGQFIEELRRHVSPVASRLGETDRRRLVENPLRLFDSKDPLTKDALQGAPTTLGYLDDNTRANFETLQFLLKEAKVPFVIDATVVRGLDYYTSTVFEVNSKSLGSQDALLGGGRYDHLVAQLGGPQLAAVGFSIGEDRLVDCMPLSAPRLLGLVFVIPQSQYQASFALKVASEIRSVARNTVVETDLSGRGFQKALSQLNRVFTDSNLQEWINNFDPDRIEAVLLGPEEQAAGAVTLKRMATGEQTKIPLSNLENHYRHADEGSLANS